MVWCVKRQSCLPGCKHAQHALILAAARPHEQLLQLPHLVQQRRLEEDAHTAPRA